MFSNLDKTALEGMIRRVLLEKLGDTSSSACPVKQVNFTQYAFTDADRLDTGNHADRVWTHDLFSLEESPRLGAGLMQMEGSCFPWTLSYDEIDYILEGTLSIEMNGTRVTARAGELLCIPKGSAIRFCAEDRAKFLYFVYPADWQSAKEKA